MFKQAVKFKNHLNERHKNGQKWKGYECKKCGKCGKCFVNFKDLNMHKLNEHPDSMKKCKLCDAKFVSCNALYRHKLEIHGIGGFECKECDIIFLKKFQLTNHLKWDHDKNNPRRQLVSCAECGRVMKKSSLMIHLRKKH